MMVTYNKKLISIEEKDKLEVVAMHSPKWFVEKINVKLINNV